MNINGLNVAQRYAQSRLSDDVPPAQVGIGDAVKNLSADFATTLQETEATAKAAMTSGADPHTLVQALAQTQLAVETAVTVRDKVVEAYQEILRMPV